MGDYGRARDLAIRALATAQAAGADVEESFAHNVLGVIALNEADFQTSRRHLERCVSLAEAIGWTAFVGAAELNLGILALKSGDTHASIPLFEDLLAEHRRDMDDEGIGFASLNLGLAAYRLGDHATAGERFDEARTAFGAIGFRAHVGHALQGLAAVEARIGTPLEAARLLGRADALLAEVGASMDDFDPSLASDVEAESRARLGDDAFAAAYEEGRQAPTAPHSISNA
jgi:tetratricopeptide (TPR) repeat protein